VERAGLVPPSGLRTDGTSDAPSVIDAHSPPLRLVVETVVESRGAACAAVELVDPDAAELVVRACAGDVTPVAAGAAPTRPRPRPGPRHPRGPGYAGLAYLQRVPTLDLLTLDRSLVQQLDVPPVDQGIVRSVVQLAQECGLGLVTEGVGTADQARLLHRLRVRLAQGHHFGKAAPLRVPAVAEPTTSRRRASRPSRWRPGRSSRRRRERPRRPRYPVDAPA
jgi:hypothetical protein